MAYHHENTGNLMLAFALNFGFTILEIVGGLLINSVAILSDAVHDLGDSISLGLAWQLNRISEKEDNERYSYGYVRFSLLGALINTIILVVGSVIILTQAVPRLIDPQSFDAQGMVLFGIIGVAANGAAAYRLRGAQSKNVQVVSWHLLEDVLGWVAVLIVGIISLFIDVPILDPLLSIFITLFILYNVANKLLETVNLFLQAVPVDIDMAALKDRLLRVDGVDSAHHTHVWSLDGEHHVFTSHIVVDENASREAAYAVKKHCREQLAEFEFTHITIETEFGPDDCSMC
ncbi:MAG: cation diffusion facilitator family transporter [Chloroflexi bacterium]|nr:cation diffusion facilitator family transporter [Chloroflexota bacterium]